MEKRVSSRAIIFQDGSLLTLFRRKRKEGTVKEYYVIPGGGIEAGETLEENVIRELKEELSIDIKILGYLGKEEKEETIAHFFHCEITNGIPTLGGEELERMTEDNYYEVQRMPIKDIDKVDIQAKEMIKKAIKKEYETLAN